MTQEPIMSDDLDPDDTLRIPSAYCRIPRLTPREADAPIGALESILMALADARWPEPPRDLCPRRPQTETDEIPF